MLVGGKPLGARTYYVAMSDQVFKFLNALAGNQLQSIPTGLNEYTIVRDYMRSLRFVRYDSQGRIKDTGATTTAVK